MLRIFEIKPLIESEVYYIIKDGILKVYYEPDEKLLGTSEFPVKINSDQYNEEQLTKIAEKFDYSISDVVFNIIDSAIIDKEMYNFLISEESVTYYDYEKKEWITSLREGIFEWLANHFEMQLKKTNRKGVNENNKQQEEIIDIRKEAADIIDENIVETEEIY